MRVSPNYDLAVQWVRLEIKDLGKKETQKNADLSTMQVFASTKLLLIGKMFYRTNQGSDDLINLAFTQPTGMRFIIQIDTRNSRLFIQTVHNNCITIKYRATMNII